MRPVRPDFFHLRAAIGPDAGLLAEAVAAESRHRLIVNISKTAIVLGYTLAAFGTLTYK